jgi:hypothetical protein
MNCDIIDRLKKANGIDWYAVTYKGDEDNPVIVHSTGLSSILECGHDPEDYDIIDMQQCGY